MENFLSNCFGIDVSKGTLDLHVTIDKSDYRFNNSDTGIKQILELCHKLNPQLTTLEATGGYEHQAYTSLATEGYPVAVVNPGRVRHFAMATGQMAKTDKIDARMIANYAQIIQPPAKAVVDEKTVILKDLTARRRQLIEMLTAEKNHSEHCYGKVVKKSVKSVIEYLNKRIEDIDKEIAEYINKTPELKHKSDLLKTIPGVGEVTAMAIVINLPELGHCNRKEIARLCGVAPLNRDSGKKTGKRFTGGGRVDIRTNLFMPVLVAIKHNPDLKNFYTRLVEEKHKPKMVAIVATMRKLICVMNSIIQNDQPWNNRVFTP